MIRSLVPRLIVYKEVLIKSKSLVYVPIFACYIQQFLYNLGYKISVPAEGVASFNQKGHEWALAHFKNSLGAEVEQHV